MSAGTVVNVVEVLAGSELVGNTSIGAGTITVVDPTDFNPEGGTFQLGAELVTYTSVDDVTAIVTLSGTLAATHTDGDRVDLLPATVERWAHVLAEDQEEALEARVPHALYDRVPVGVRDEALSELELVELERDTGGELIVADVLQAEPVVDGSFIDTTTLPPNPTDGAPPAASPTAVVKGGIGSLFISWLVVANADPLTYEVHLSTSSGFTPGPTTFAGQTDGTMAVIRKLPLDGSALDGSGATTYYAKIIAKDTDGAAAAGVEGSGAPEPATTPELAVGSVVADTVFTNSLTADRLASVLLLANLIQTADAGARVELGPGGIKLYAADESVVVNIPTDPGQSPTFRGDVVTGGLTVLGNASIQGATNVMDKGSALTLLGKLSDPATAPTVTLEYDTDALPSPIPDETRVIGLDFDTNGNGTTTDTYLLLGYGLAGNVTLYEVSAARPVTLLRSSALFPTANLSGGSGGLYGVARCGGYIWVLYTSVGGNLTLRAFDAATLAGAGTTNVTTLSGYPIISGIGGQGYGFGTDGTNLLILGWASGSNGANKHVIRLSISGSTPAYLDDFDLTGGKTRTSSSGLGGITGRDGTHYTTTTKLQIGGLNVSVFENFLVSTKALDTADGSVWTPDSVNPGSGNAPGEVWRGCTYDGTRYHALGIFTAIVEHFSGWVWTPGSNADTWWIGYTWYQATGTLESGVSPRKSVVLNGAGTGGRVANATYIPMRGQLRVASPPLPADASASKVYELPSSSAPATTALHVQTPASTVYGVSADTFILTTYSGAGAAPDVAHPFPGGNSTIQGDVTAAGVTAVWKLGGDGTHLLTRSTTAQRPGTPQEADLRYNEDLSVPEFYDGAGWKGCAVQLATVGVNIASTAGSTSGTQTVSVSGLRVGDLCFFIGVDTNDAIQFHFRTEPVCVSAGQIVLRYFNCDTATRDPASASFRFLIVRVG